MPIASESALVSALASAQRQPIYKATQTTEGAGTFSSLWKVAGFPAAGANPPLYSAGSGYTPDKSSVGAMSFANPGGSNTLYLGRLALAGATAGTLILYDRLWACSGFDTTLLTAQAVVTPGSLPAGRDIDNGASVEPWIEIYTAPGATAATWTLTGTDANGNAGVTWTYAHPANAETANQMAPFVMGTATAPGCRQVDSLTCSASSGTAGSVGVTLLRRLCEIANSSANVVAVLDAISTGLPIIPSNACLAMMLLCTTTTTGILQGRSDLIQG